MKTTLNISDVTMREIKREAARRQQTMSELVEAALRTIIEPVQRETPLPPLPEFRSGGLRVNVANREALYEVMGGLVMFVVDTNILIYGVDMDAPDHASCRALLEQWRSQRTPWYVTWGIVYEFIRVVTHPRVLSRPFSAAQAWLFLDALFASPSLRILSETDRHRHVAAEVFADVPGLSGNLVFDAHTAILTRENGIRTIYTRDTDFNRFPFLDTVDPVTEQRRTTVPRRLIIIQSVREKA